MCQKLENSNSVSVLVLDVVINGDDEHEDKEDSSPAKKVPDVVPEKTVSFKMMDKKEEFTQFEHCTFFVFGEGGDYIGPLMS